MPYKGPGFYNKYGERVCSFHPDSMKAFIDSRGFALIENTEEYEYLEENVIEQARRDLKNELYGPRKQYQLDPEKWGGTD